MSLSLCTARRLFSRVVVLGALCAFVVPTLFAADWPQWRGPKRDGVSEETGLLASWSKQGPPLVWAFKETGTGYSGPAVVGRRLYTMGARGDTELVIALDAATGKEIWAAKVGPTFAWKGNVWNAGPSATPTVDGGAVYALGGQGDFVCVEAASGKEKWRTSMPRDLAGEVNPVGGGPEKIGWGWTWSPLVDGNNVIVVPGGPRGLVAALDKATGKLVWRSREATAQATYASPVVAEIGGVRQYVCVVQDGLVGVAAKDGKLLWSFRRDEAYPDVVIPTPIVRDNLVYTTAGGGGTCDLVQVTVKGDTFQAERAWGNKDLASYIGGAVLVGDHVYAYHERNSWKCQEWKTGKIAWTSGRRGLGAGSVTAADGRLYCFTEDGTAALVEASPTAYQEKGRFKIPETSTKRLPSGKAWTPPVIADGKLYLRDQELLYCFDIKEKK